jgi:hypothetical protein
VVDLRPDSDPASLEVLLEVESPWLHFHKPLPDPLLAAAAEIVRQRPDVRLSVSGWEIETLAWLERFDRLEHLIVNLFEATSFDEIAHCPRLRTLALGETRSRKPGLEVLRSLPDIERLYLNGHHRDFEAVARLSRLRQLSLHPPRPQSLEVLRGHEQLEILSMNFGNVPELGALTDLPGLRALEMFSVRKLTTEGFDPVGECALEVVSLEGFHHIDSLRAFAGPRIRSTLRFLTLTNMTKLSTLADLVRCEQLEQLSLIDARPADRRLDHLLACPSLTHLSVGDVYTQGQVDVVRTAFADRTLRIRDTVSLGASRSFVVGWRKPIDNQLARADAV